MQRNFCSKYSFIVYFLVLDEDNSKLLEFNEFKLLCNHITTVLNSKGYSPTEISQIMGSITKLLDPSNSGFVTKENFLLTGEKYPDFVDILIPKPLIILEHSSLLLRFSNDHLNEVTSGLFKLIATNPGDHDHIKVYLQKP